MSFLFRAVVVLCLLVSMPSPLAAKDIADELAPQSALSREEGFNIQELTLFYQARDFKPVWDVSSEKGLQIFLSFTEYMKKLCEENGLESQTETIDFFTQLAKAPRDLDESRFDIAVSHWLLQIAHELNGDSVNYKGVFKSWAFEQNNPTLAVDLAHAIKDGKIYEFLPSLAPDSLNYLLMAQALRLYRTIAVKQPWTTIDDGPILRPNDHGLRVKQTRKRLESEAYMLPLCQTEEEEKFFADDLKKVIIAYQSRNGLETDGNIGPDTVAAMNRPVDYRIDQIRANMAFVRALPRQWPDYYAYVNIADASIKIFRKGENIYHAQVVLGLPSRRTPFIQSAIDTVILNPMWKIPISIARYDILPKLKKNPYYLEEKGFAIKGRSEDPYGTQIDWENMGPRQFHYQLRQSPGELNALGSTKFDFKNDHSVYLHGTPHKEDFVKAKRHLSSGCIRLKDPEQVAAVILGHNKEKWSLQDIKNEIGGKDVFKIEVDEKLPIFVVYQTVIFPSEDISAHFRRDVYGYDRLLLAAMKTKTKNYKSLFSKNFSE